jgi:hypothetical protein
VSLSDLLPSWQGFRDSLWASLGMLAMTAGVTWGVAWYKKVPASRQFVFFLVTEILSGLTAAAAVLRFGVSAWQWGAAVVILPVAVLAILEGLGETRSGASPSTKADRRTAELSKALADAEVRATEATSRAARAEASLVKAEAASKLGAAEVEAPEPLARPDTVEQFRVFHQYLARALQWAIDFLSAGICGHLVATGSVNTLVAELIWSELLPASRQRKQDLETLLEFRDLTAKQLQDAAEQARSLLYDDYRRITFWIERTTEAMRGEQDFVQTAGYRELRNLHWELALEAGRIHTHSELRGIVPTLDDLRRFLPGKPRESATSPLDGMTARELWVHVTSEGSSAFLGREWEPDGLKIAGEIGVDERLQVLRLPCRAGDGTTVILETKRRYAPEEEKAFRPGKTIGAYGSISSITGGTISLTDVEIYHWESDAPTA